ncbi:MAG: 3-deoxy-D-manno-octulosonic acid transferase [Gammaproteobacteria bacterium]|nr:3-deoxy-D-manno-octulosonic acid transferase [Gammaproteobacteria bacterium]
MGMLTLYRFILYLISPIILGILALKAIRNPAFRPRLGQRFGFSTVNPIPGGIWIHAVSVGEVNAAMPLIQYALKNHPDLEITVTTMTATGSARVMSLFPQKIHHRYLPYDYPGAVSRFINTVKPSVAMIMETEIWPNLIDVCHRKKIPVIYTNARLSRRSYEKYQRIQRLIGPTLRKVDRFAVQGSADADRLIKLGAVPDTVSVTGNLKFDIPVPASLEEAAQDVRRHLGHDRFIWIAGSTHDGEEEQVIDAFRSIRESIPELLLVLVPRHPERFSLVARLCDREGFNLVRRSEHLEPVSMDTEIYLGDTMGELTLLLAASDVAFIGGSLVPIGGHNLLEANALGVPVVFGPHMHNFLEISQLVSNKGAGVEINDSDELANVVVKLLQDPVQRDQYGSRGKELVMENKGALGNIANILKKQLGSRG